jgi:hypothetical protein
LQKKKELKLHKPPIDDPEEAQRREKQNEILAMTQHDPKFFLCQICLDEVVAILERERERRLREL